MYPPTCRVCLVTNIKMHTVKNSDLLQIYEKITNLEVTKGKMRTTVCYLCFPLLRKCWKFCKMVQKTAHILKTTYNSDSLVDLQTHNYCITTVLNLDLLKNEKDKNEIDYKDLNYICMYESSPIKVEAEVKDEMAIKLESSDDNNYEPASDDEVTNESLKNNTENKLIESRFNCHKCSKTFVLLKNLEIHMRVHNKERTFPCSICNKSFLYRAYLKKHMQRHKDGPSSVTDGRPYICDRCSKRFKESSHLRDHLRTHTGEQPFSCNTCGKRFNQKGNLRLHIKIHNAEKTFACEICGRTFLLKCQLKSHYQLHSDDKPYACNGCAMTFTYKSALKQHIRRIHSQVKAFSCNLCGRSFDQECVLTKHIKSHSMAKVYNCEICKRSYKKAETLKRHMLIHNEETPYVCDRCNKAFKVLRYLQQHKRCSARCRNFSEQATNVGIVHA